MADETPAAFAARFDRNRPVQLQGRVIRMEWANPRCRIHIDVIDSKTGRHSQWIVEGGSPAVLLRKGWTRKTLTPGMEIITVGPRSRDGSNHASCADISFPDGRQMSLGNPLAEAVLERGRG